MGSIIHCRFTGRMGSGWLASTTRMLLSAERRDKLSIIRIDSKPFGPNEYKNAATLLADFWTLVDAVLREKGIL
jgi:hypothetical protein